MSKNNGHSRNGSSNGKNGHPENGGKGAVRPVDPEATKVRENMRFILTAVRNGWDIPEGWQKDVPAACMEILRDTNRSERDRLRAAEVIRGMANDMVNWAQIADKLERLDDGSPTERIEYTQEDLELASEIQKRRLGVTNN